MAKVKLPEKPPVNMHKSMKAGDSYQEAVSKATKPAPKTNER